MNGAALAFIALLPAAAGPLPSNPTVADLVLTAKLCGGASDIEIVIPRQPGDPPPAEDCKLKACHAACNRKTLIQRKDS